MGVRMTRLTDDELRMLAAFRHDLHQHPELSGQERSTSEKVRGFLSVLPECQLIDLPMETGVVARIPGTPGTSGAPAEVMLRADIDALPQTERVDIPWKSSVPGAMHACGHDLHTTALCGAALLLGRMRRECAVLPTVDLVFQPSEETGTGAQTLIDVGLFDRIHPEACFGMHNWPSVEVGKVVCREGALMPIVCAAAIVQSLQTVVSRNVDPLVAGLVSINMIEGGSPINRVADQVRMKATVRSLSDDTLDRMIERVETIVQGTAQAYECRSEVVWGRRIPAVWNAPEMMAKARACVERSGCGLADAAPTLVGEDFAYYREHVPSFFFWVGSRRAGAEVHELHDPQFFADDSAIPYAAQLYAACAMRG